jgi:hypothetical protein
MKDEFRRRLEREFEPEVEELSRLVNWDLSAWCQSGRGRLGCDRSESAQNQPACVARSTGVVQLCLNSSWRHQRLLILCYHGTSLADEHLSLAN